jgi:hypothetical protein
MELLKKLFVGIGRKEEAVRLRAEKGKSGFLRTKAFMRRWIKKL